MYVRTEVQACARTVSLLGRLTEGRPSDWSPEKARRQSLHSLSRRHPSPRLSLQCAERTPYLQYLLSATCNTSGAAEYLEGTDRVFGSSATGGKRARPCCCAIMDVCGRYCTGRYSTSLLYPLLPPSSGPCSCPPWCPGSVCSRLPCPSLRLAY